jgi:hypothetical protein
LGYAGTPSDEYSYFEDNEPLITEHLRRMDRGIRSAGDTEYGPGVRYEGGYEQGLNLYIYRESATGFLEANDTVGQPSWNDPAVDEPGMINVEMDSRGHLTKFLAIPLKEGEGKASGGEPNWGAALAAAGLEAGQMKEVTPTLVPVVAFDWRREWVGPLPGYPAVTVRVGATGFEGKLTSFRMVAPWNVAGSGGSSQAAQAEVWIVVLMVGGCFIGGFFAIRNLRRGSADKVGALRLGIAILGMVLLQRLLEVRLVPDFASVLGRILLSVAIALLLSTLCTGAYLAVEPYLRRKMPRLLISWMQLLKGQWRSERLGRDILAGFALASLEVPLATLFIYWNERTRSGVNFPTMGLGMRKMFEPRFWMAHVLQTAGVAIFLSLCALVLYFLFRSVFRVQWLASLVLLVFFFFFGGGPPHYTRLSFFLIHLALGVLSTVIVLRFGLVSMAAFVLWGNMVYSVPVTFDFSQWYTPAAMANVAVVLAIAGYGFWIAIGEQRMFGNFKLDD